MKEMNNTERFTEREWEEVAAILSGEKADNKELLKRYAADDIHKTGEQWNDLVPRSSEEKPDIDKAWSRVHSMMNENSVKNETGSRRVSFISSRFMKIAAVTLLFLGIGSTTLYLNYSGLLSKNISVVTGIDEKNIIVNLPDGSKISLNRSTEFSYRENFGKRNRNVKLSGEAFFEITPDAAKPFIIDAGKADIKVIGTSFNVITSNSDSAVEVFVKTGKVLVSDKSGLQSLSLDPGFVGKLDSKTSGKAINKNPNYLSWNTGQLFYTGQKLSVVFSDLKRVYNMDIVAGDPSITENTWTTDPIDNQPEDTIIRLICASFNLSYTKDGNVYYLARK